MLFRSAPWNDKIHSDKTLKVEDKKTGKSYCKSSSYTIFQADQKVNYTEEIVVKEPFIPLYPEQCYMKLRFFSSRQPFPSTLNASFQEKSVGNLLIRMSRGNERKVILRISLQERIIAKARDQTSGKEYECILDPSGATNQQNNQYHIIFVLDKSGSMSCSMSPIAVKNLPADDQQLLETLNQRGDRWGSVLIACYNFIISHLASSKTQDSTSFIVFNSSAEILMKEQKLEKAVLQQLLSVEPSGGTNFSQALNKVEELLKTPSTDSSSSTNLSTNTNLSKSPSLSPSPSPSTSSPNLSKSPIPNTSSPNSSKIALPGISSNTDLSTLQRTRSSTSANKQTVKVPVIIFLSDGEDGGSNSAAIAKKIFASYDTAILHAVAVGDETGGVQTLQSLAEAGHGLFVQAKSSEELCMAFQQFAAMLK